MGEDSPVANMMSAAYRAEADSKTVLFIPYHLYACRRAVAETSILDNKNQGVPSGNILEGWLKSSYMQMVHRVPIVLLSLFSGSFGNVINKRSQQRNRMCSSAVDRLRIQRGILMISGAFSVFE